MVRRSTRRRKIRINIGNLRNIRTRSLRSTRIKSKSTVLQLQGPLSTKIANVVVNREKKDKDKSKKHKDGGGEHSGYR